jgi:hypothetical protein
MSQMMLNNSSLKSTLLAGLLSVALFSCETEKAEVREVKNKNSMTTISTPEPQNQEMASLVVVGEPVYNFGDIKQGEVVENTFTVKNTGSAPLVISNIQTTCGCTTPNYEKGTAISPGETSEILVRFNSRGKVGRQDKKVTIFANTPESVHAVYMRGNVLTDKNS